MTIRTFTDFFQIVSLFAIVFSFILKTAEGSVCNRLITNPTEVTSPNYPDNYPKNYECAWKFQASPGCKIKLNFEFFVLELTEDCVNDYVIIYDGETEDDPLIGRFCGDMKPLHTTSTGEKLLVVFRTNGAAEFQGFKFRQSTECKPPDNTSVVTSPNFPYNYPKNYDRSWKFQTVPGCRIKLNFEVFELELTEDCTNDYVVIYDGDTEDDPLIGRFCGQMKPPLTTSTGESILVVFRTDGGAVLQGFKFRQSIVCTPSDNTAVVTSPNFPYNYPKNYERHYKFQANPGCKVKLNFEVFVLELTEDCTNDYVAIYDGDSEGDPLIGRFCGQNKPPLTISSGERILVVFRTDGGAVLQGFKFRQSSECSRI